MCIAKSFKVGKRAFSLLRVKNAFYLNGEKVDSLHTLQKELFSNAENQQDASMVRNLLSICASGRISHV